jgi:hypothetical protein
MYFFIQELPGKNKLSLIRYISLLLPGYQPSALLLSQLKKKKTSILAIGNDILELKY